MVEVGTPRTDYEYAWRMLNYRMHFEALLEAALIIPYLDPNTNYVSNGLLPRADLHNLFDLHMFGIDPKTHTVRICDALKTSALP